MSLDWQALMEQWNALLLKKRASELPAELINKGWLGQAGATNEQLEALEQRLNTPLPPSYRSFLKFTNGWHGMLDDFIYKLWSTEEIDWFTKRNQAWIDAWVYGTNYFGDALEVSDEDYFVYGDEQASYHLRPDYLPHMLEISEEGDSAILLLNPLIKTEDGEWEAWFFASWLPGASRYRSFAELMQDTFDNRLAIEDE